jgi:hypothetical protein
MIYLLIYAYCTVSDGCHVSQHSGHATMAKCEKTLEDQRLHWEENKHIKHVTLSCVNITGMATLPETK